MPEFTATERRWVLADYPYTVEAINATDALLKVARSVDVYPDRASEVDWEVTRPSSWDVYGPTGGGGWKVQIDLDADDHLRLSRLGFIGVREEMHADSSCD